jgi:hypothetical protein
MTMTKKKSADFSRRTDECPASRKTAVDAILRHDVEDGRITAEQYAEITGKRSF